MERQRTILHCDLNNFYASVETLHRPELRGKPLAVGGEAELRHGIVLAKNYEAKRFGVKTGEALWEARRKCPGITILPPDYPLYLKVANLTWDIFNRYTDRVESFGLDEAWLDVSESLSLFGSGKEIADNIRGVIKTELGLTASVGVSYNKVFAKMGSDMKKPDATTEIYIDDFKKKIWPLPVSDLMYVGGATRSKLKKYGINTVGDLARTSSQYLDSWFGKFGIMLWHFANGLDASPVSSAVSRAAIKTVGNMSTTPRDLICDDDIRITLVTLCESVAARLREYGFLTRTVQLHVRFNDLEVIERQAKLPKPMCVSKKFFDTAYSLFKKNVPPPYKIRTLGVRAFDLSTDGDSQLTFFPDLSDYAKYEKTDLAVEDIRRRFGHGVIKKGIMLFDEELGGQNPQEDHLIQTFLR